MRKHLHPIVLDQTLGHRYFKELGREAVERVPPLGIVLQPHDEVEEFGSVGLACA